jgi:hypothetical protein
MASKGAMRIASSESKTVGGPFCDANSSAIVVSNGIGIKHLRVRPYGRIKASYRSWRRRKTPDLAGIATIFFNPTIHCYREG